MNEYIVSQMQQDAQQWEGSQANIMMSVIIRKVNATNEQEAIGKFVLGTKGIIASKKLNIECVELNRMIPIE